MEQLKIYWNWRYVPEGDTEPDDKNRWMIEGNLKIDCRGMTSYEWLDHGRATVAYITKKGTANANFVDHQSIPEYNVRVNNVLEESSLFNTGYGNTSNFFDSIDACKAFAERIINFHFDMLGRAETKPSPSGEEPYPLTVVADRYGGTYSGGKWLAFNEYPQDVPEEPFADDMTCGYFWDDDRLVGIGNTRGKAIRDLRRKL